MIRAIIFDFDGLLVDTEIVSYEIYKELMEHLGYEFTKSEYARNYSGKTEIKNVNRLIETYHLPWTTEIGLKKVLEVETRLLDQGVALKQGVKELLSFLKENNYKTGIATSSTKDRAIKILKQHNIIDYFNSFVFGDEVEKGKPNPDIFLKACEKLGEKPENCLILEDSEAGIEAAYLANIPVICIPDMKIPAKQYLEKAISVYQSLDNVIGFLQKESLR